MFVFCPLVIYRHLWAFTDIIIVNFYERGFIMKLAQCIILDLLAETTNHFPSLPETSDFHFSGVQLLDQDNPTDDPSILLHWKG